MEHFGPLPQVEGNEPVRRGTFYDIEVFGAITAEEGTITGDVTIEGTLSVNDILSSNWDGADPVDLSSTYDGAATVGYAFDASAGALQAMGDVWFGGDVTILSGGVLQTGTSGEYIRINGATGQITFSSAASEQVNPALIAADNLLTTEGYLSMRGPVLGDGILGTNNGYGLLNLSSSELSAKGSVYLSALGDGNWDAEWFGLATTQSGTGDAQVYLSALSGSGNSDITINTQSTSGTASFSVVNADTIYLAGTTVTIDAGTPEYVFTSGAEFQIDSNGTQFHGVLRIKQESDGSARIGFYDSSAWQDHMHISDGFWRVAPGGTVKLGVYVGKGGDSWIPYTNGAVYLTADDDEAIWFRDYNGTTYTTRAAITNGDDLVVLGAVRAGSISTSALTNGYIYATPGTTGSAANATWINASGSTYYIQRSTSKREYKRKINYDIIDRLAGYEIRPTHHWRIDDKRWRYGLIYEDLEAVDPKLVDEEQPDWNAVVSVLAAKIIKLEQQVAALEAA